MATKPAASGVASSAPKASAENGAASASLPHTLAALLSPGMSAKAEIITGKRTVLDYILSPISKATQEAGRER